MLIGLKRSPLTVTRKKEDNVMAQEMTTASNKEVATAAGNGEATRASIVFAPTTDIFESEDHIVVVADMPGVAPDAVDITLERRVLTIRGRTTSQRHQGYRLVYQEYGEGDYERV